MSHQNLCLLLNLFSNASDALRAARADGRHYVPLSLNRLGRVINTHGDILVSNANLDDAPKRIRNVTQESTSKFYISLLVILKRRTLYTLKRRRQ